MAESPFPLRSWKQPLTFTLGVYTVENKLRLLCYSPCTCREKYKFRNGSLLLSYLKQCDGWIPDPQGYTVNYIMIVLLAHLKEKRLVTFSRSLSKHLVIPDSELKNALIEKVPTFRFDLSSIRLFILKYHLKYDCKISYQDTPYFICPRGAEEIVENILGPAGSNETYFGYHE